MLPRCKDLPDEVGLHEERNSDYNRMDVVSSEEVGKRVQRCRGLVVIPVDILSLADVLSS